MFVREKIQRLLGNKSSNRRFIAEQASGLYSLRVLYKAINFGIAILLAHWLGQASFGVYTLSSSWASLLAIPAALGMERLTVREVSSAMIHQTWGILKGYTKWMFTRAVISSLVVCVVMILGSLWFYQNDPATLWTFIATAPMIPAMVIVRQIQATQDGLKNMAQARIPDMLIQPLAFIVIISIMYWQFPASLNAASASGVYVITTLILSIGIGVWLLRQKFPAQALDVQPELNLPVWLKSSLAFLTIGIIFNADSRVSTLLLGALAEKTDVATYGVLTRVVDLLTFVLLSVAGPVSRLGLQYYHEGNTAKLQNLLTRTARTATAIGWTMGLLIILFGKWYLLIFGSEYLQGYPGLILLVLAEMINLATGLSGFLLTLTKHETVTARVFVLGLIINITVGIFLIPRFGLIGAALSEMSSVMFRNIVISVMTYKLIGVNPTVFTRRRA